MAWGLNIDINDLIAQIIQVASQHVFTRLVEAHTPCEYKDHVRTAFISANRIGVKFDDIGALDDVKELLHQQVMLPIRRPDLFLEPCRGILLYGPPGTGKTMLAKAIASEAGARFINLCTSTIMSPWMGESEKYVRAVFKFASEKAPAIIFIDEVDSLLGQRNSHNEYHSMRAVKNEFMTHWDGLLTNPGKRILVLGATNRPFDLDEAIIRRFQCRIMVDLPSEESREMILKTIMSKQNTNDLDFKELATMTKGYTGSDLKNLCKEAANRPVMELLWQEKKMNNATMKQKAAKVGTKDAEIVKRPVNMEDMRQAKNRVAASFASGGAVMNELKRWHELYGIGGSRKEARLDFEFEKRIRPDIIPANEIGVTFDEIGALDDIKESLQELVMLPLRRPDLFKGGLLKPCRGILLFGPPGTGKTMLAKAIASEAGANFINVSMSTITANWIGEGEKNVRALFSLAAKDSPTIIFVDEVDSMLGQQNGEDEAMRRIKNEFMTHWDGLMTKPDERILVLAATNRPFDLDEAIIRRFERRIMVGLPSAESREMILKTLMAREKAEDLDFKELATMTEGYTGSDLKKLCVMAAYRPLRELLQRERTMKDKEKNRKAEDDTSPPKEEGKEEAEIVLRPLNMEDMRQTKNKVAASFASEGAVMDELKHWNELYREGD